MSCLLNTEQAARLEKDGFVVFQLCDETQIQRLNDLYQTVPADSSSLFWSSSFLEDTEFKIDLSKKAEAVFEPSLTKVLDSHQTLGCSFLTKFPGKNSEMPIHQDWTVVDETKFGSYTIWMPIQNATAENGALQVIPGSHKLSSELRSPSLPVTFEGIRKQLRPYLQLVELKAGEAMLFNHALMHSSPANTTDEPRVAVTYGFVPKEASLCMYYSKADKVQKYNMPSDMFIKYPQIRNEPLIGDLSEEFDYSVNELSFEKVEKILGKSKFKSTMKPLFKDPKLQKFFETNGFVRVPALGQEDIEKLIALYKDLGLTDEKGYGFHVGMDNADKQLVQRMVDGVKEVALPKLESKMADTQVFTASFVVKEPNAQGVVPPHQDWSFVENEKEHCSVSCWIPLQDVNMENGCIGVIKGSNRFFKNVRPSPSPQVETPLKKHMYTIFPFLELQEMKAGEALIFDNRTFHASPPNTTDSTRIAVGLGFTQAEAEIRHYTLKPGTDNTLIKYKIDPDFFLKYDNSSLSEMYEKGEEIEGYEKVGEMAYEWEDLSADEMKNLIESAGNTFNAPLVETMTKLFVQSPQEEKPAKKEAIVEQVEVHDSAESANSNERTFWQTYTPINILKEVRFRLTGKE
ncbi:MAG: ectoine hydroxylase-related dioxygenase (phytanoyl-CoA dioxygenase family) [Bacteroidia bacterium]|jgi:ectoine hydroxylase-related dioxygenase (phytanoyl-CoA dioxygenase family)